MAASRATTLRPPPATARLRKTCGTTRSGSAAISGGPGVADDITEGVDAAGAHGSTTIAWVASGSTSSISRTLKSALPRPVDRAAHDARPDGVGQVGHGRSAQRAGVGALEGARAGVGAVRELLDGPPHPPARVSSRSGAAGSSRAREAVDFDARRAGDVLEADARHGGGASHARLTACKPVSYDRLRGGPVIVLRDERVLVRLDPRHGGELLDLVDRRTGRQLLGRAPFASQEPAVGALDEPTWTAGYRGGWQVLLPNAGNECVVDGADHGFHGAASHEPWAVLAQGPAEARLRWAGHGLVAERRVTVEDGAVVAETEVRGLDGAAPLTPVEHLSVGLELLDPEVAIELPGGRAYELHEQDGPARPPAGAPAWPEVALLDGGRERADRWPLAQPRSRYLVVTDLPEGVATIRNTGTGQGVELRWDVAVLPHVWIWHEVRRTRASGAVARRSWPSSRRRFRTAWAWRRRCARGRR